MSSIAESLDFYRTVLSSLIRFISIHSNIPAKQPLSLSNVNSLCIKCESFEIASTSNLLTAHRVQACVFVRSVIMVKSGHDKSRSISIYAMLPNVNFQFIYYNCNKLKKYLLIRCGYRYCYHAVYDDNILNANAVRSYRTN